MILSERKDALERYIIEILSSIDYNHCTPLSDFIQAEKLKDIERKVITLQRLVRRFRQSCQLRCIRDFESSEEDDFEKLDDFEILNVVGKGSFGRVR